MSNYKKWLGYLLFALILTVALLYYRFPSDALRDYLQSMAHRANPPLALSVDSLELSLPIGLKLLETQVALKDMPDRVLVRADSLLIRPQVWSLFRGKPVYRFHCVAYRGDLVGSVYVEKDDTRGFIDTKIDLRNIHVADHAYLSQLVGRHVEGTLDGTVSYKGQRNPLVDGSGQANLRVSQGRVELLQPFITLESIDFNVMEIEVVLKKQNVNLNRLELKGQQLHGTLSGTITLKQEFAKSRLDLKGTVEPFAGLFKGPAGTGDTVQFFKQRLKGGAFPVVIQGTVEEPKIEFK
ncbi:MAG TPA: type II secretion system protein GspN [Desulfobacterales bacterium]|nr:type II secretion system protein GspN [Desulfobacterales bacterium]